MDPLEFDYKDVPSMMYEDDSPLDEDYLSMMRYILSTAITVIHGNVLAFSTLSFHSTKNHVS